MRAKDVMSRPVFTVTPSDSIERAAATFSSHQITSAPVVDSAGDLVGMVSEVDLLLRPESGAGLAVGDVMTEDVVVVPPDAELADIAKTMIEYQVRCVPVMDGGDIVGVISRRDILHSTVRPHALVTDELQRRLDDYAGIPLATWKITVHDGVATIAGEFDDDAHRGAIRALALTVPGVTAVEIRTISDSP